MTILVLVVPTILAWVAEVSVGLIAPTARRFAHATIAAVILATISVEVLKKQFGWGAAVLLVVAAILGVAGGVLLLRFDAVRRFLRYLAFAPIAFAVLFVFFSPVSTLLFPSKSSAAKLEIGNPSRVVMVVMDELPVESLLDGNGKVDATLFPNFASLANGSTWYRNTTTVSPYTETAVPAILDGDLPPKGSPLPTASEYPNNLFTLLGGRYQMNVHETVTHMCPEDLCPTRDRGQAHAGLLGFLADTKEIWSNFASPTHPLSQDVGREFSLTQIASTQRAGGPFIRSLKPARKPRLDFLHVVLPHQGWHYIATGQDNHSSFEGDQRLDEGGRAVWPTAWAAKVGRQRHLLQLQYTDQVLGRMLNKLKQIRAYDNSLVVVTADHGVAFDTAEPVRGVSAKNYAQVMWTPLFVKTPGQTQGGISDQPVQSIDVLPTIADLLDAKVPWKMDGRSTLGPPRQEGLVPILPWGQGTLVPPEGHQFSEVDGANGFASAINGRASSATGDPALRLYRIGPYGALIGTAAKPLVAGPVSTARASITDRPKFAAVDLSSQYIPWQRINGTLQGVEPGRTLAIGVNGIVAGISEVTRSADGHNTYWSSLPPQFFVDGHNDVRVYVVSGSPSAPTLAPIPLAP